MITNKFSDIDALIEELRTKISNLPKNSLPKEITQKLFEFPSLILEKSIELRKCNWTCDACPQGHNIEYCVSFLAEIAKGNLTERIPTTTGIEVIDALSTSINMLTEELDSKNKQIMEVQDLSKMGFWDWNIETNELIWTDGVYNIMEINNKEELEVNLNTFSSFVHPDDKEKVNFEVNYAIEHNTPYYTDHRVILKNGKIKHLNEQGKVFYQNEKPIRMLGTVQDITERILRENEFKKVYSAVESSINPVFIADVNGGINYANKAAASTWGFSDIKEMLETCPNALNYWQNEHISLALEVLTDLISKGTHKPVILNAKRKDGSLFYANVSASNIKGENGEIIGVVGSFENVTKMIETEQEIKKLSTVATKTGYNVIITDSLGQVQWVNESFEKTTGYSINEIVGKSLEILQGEETSKKEVKKIKKMLSNGEKVSGEILNYRKNGEPFWFDYDIVPVFNDVGTVTNFITTQSEITERKKLQKTLSDSIADKEVLLSEVHHRVKNNLQIVSGIIDMQLKRVEDEGTIRALKDTKNRIHSISVVHEKLYTHNSFSSINLKQYLSELAINIRKTYDDQNKILLDINIENISININQAIPLGLILNEILSNAFKYAFNNEMNGEIIFVVQQSKNNFIIKVEDNGIGFDLTNVKQNVNSIGIKLIEALSKQLEASLTIKTSAEKGTIFNITVPKKA